MNYTLKTSSDEKSKSKNLSLSIGKLLSLLKTEKSKVLLALVFSVVNSAITLLSPILISHIIDTYIAQKQFSGVLIFSGILLVMFVVGLISSYFETIIMGNVGRRILFNLRNEIFNKLQELPVSFFNQNKVGDLISRINNDTEKLNQFFAQAFNQLFEVVASTLGVGIFMIALNHKLGAVTLFPALLVIILTQVLSKWVKSKNLKSLEMLGKMSAEIQESLDNFKVVVVFNRLDYFNKRFGIINNENYNVSIKAGIANNIFNPIYTLVSNLAQLIVLGFGVFLITQGQFTVGLLVGFLLYVDRFYTPLRRFASVWSTVQSSLAALERISEILLLKSNLEEIKTDNIVKDSKNIIEFKNVTFKYNDNNTVFENINLSLEKGKTYALVGPTGGGKTTTASLMARLYDPTSGEVLLDGRDIRSYSKEERTKKIGFILQEPFLFTGTIKENILYGNNDYINYSDDDLLKLLKDSNLENLVDSFEEGINTKIIFGKDNISLGQKQIIAFIRAILRKPEILILDEATANIDTVTEKLLEDIIDKLPNSTTKVIIAHRLNTIENADQIFFVNSGIMLAGSMEDAVDMLMNKKRNS